MVLRVETVINNPEYFRVRKTVKLSGKTCTEWVQMRKGVGYLFRYRDLSWAAHYRYLDALAVVSDSTAKVRELDAVTRRKITPSDRSAKAFNPLCRNDLQLFQAVNTQVPQRRRGFPCGQVAASVGVKLAEPSESHQHRQQGLESRLGALLFDEVRIQNPSIGIVEHDHQIPRALRRTRAAARRRSQHYQAVENVASDLSEGLPKNQAERFSPNAARTPLRRSAQPQVP